MQRFRKWLSLLWVITFLVGIAACASGQAESNVSDWSAFLRLLTTPGGGAIVVGVLLSAGYEYVPGLTSLVPKWKRLVFLGLCLAVPLVAAGLGIWTEQWLPTWRETFWPAIVCGFTTFGSGTITHTPKLPNAPPVDADAG